MRWSEHWQGSAILLNCWTAWQKYQHEVKLFNKQYQIEELWLLIRFRDGALLSSYSVIASFAACCRLIIWCRPADYQSWTNITRRWWHYSWSVDNTCRHYLHRWWHCWYQFQCHQRWLSMSPSNICLQMMTLLPPRDHISSISLVCCFWPEHLSKRQKLCLHVDKRTYHITYHLCICV